MTIAREILQDTVGVTRGRAQVIGLTGELGSGKTTWTRGIVSALGGDPDQVQSPTFVLMRDYDLGENIYNFKTLHHLDVYRLESPSELASLKLNAWLDDPSRIFVIEWWQTIKPALPKWLVGSMAELTFETINDYTKTIAVAKV